MATAREKIPQLGLWDDEVPKISHDKVVLWAYKNAEVLLREYLLAFPDRDPRHAASDKWDSVCIQYARANKKLSELPPLPPKPTTLVKNRVLEKVIMQHPEHGRSLPRILGYADLVIEWAEPMVEWSQEHSKWYLSSNGRALLVEAKTTMPSLGELMRQINLYRQVYGSVVVVGQDDSYAEILREQGVLFVKYSEGGEA
jgi:hypothetical protein